MSPADRPDGDVIPTTADAVAASAGVAQARGLPSGRPVVVAEGYSVRVRLDPAPVLTRVVTAGRTLRGEPLAWMQREVAVAGFLAAAGAPVVPPWPDPGPHRSRGLDVSLWRWFRPVPQPLAPRRYAVLLKALHDALRSYEADLPVLVGPLTDIATARRLSDDPLLHDAAGGLVPLALTWPRRPIHGDAHTGNVLLTESGPLWTDFEDVCIGPLEWDLASRTLSDEVVDAYPGPVDRALLEDCRDLRCLQILAAMLTEGVTAGALFDDVTSRLRRRAS